MPKVVDHEQRRRELVEASWEVIAGSGIEGATLRNVALAAGCTTGRISHYFSGREDLLSSALAAAHDDAERRMVAIVKTTLPVKERLRLVVGEALPFDALRLREWKVWIVFWAAASSNRSLAGQNKARYKGWRRMLFKLMSQIETLDLNEADLRVEEMLAIIDGLGLRVTLNNTPDLRSLARKTIDAYIDRL
ncbi:MAG: TetR family transcriptional regulator C-terminal domain-containing protein [Proteobacteria bacterium]|nr:TetR family transcriptional regulator C-terminal domain-containing protein [Pseudomonadota bacterium]